MRISAFWTLIVALLLALPLCAQIDNGNITGRVTDPSGAVIAGAQVTVTQTEMNFESVAATSAEGIYWTRNLRPGPYRLSIVAQGFKKLTREGIDLRVGQTLEVNGALEVGALADSVEVTSAAPLLETETSSTGATVAGDYFYSFPNYQRNVTAVLFYTPGISFTVGAYTGRFDNIKVDGLANSTIGVFTDGALSVSAGQTSATEAIDNTVEDIKVLTTTLPAEYGHSMGAVISVVTKNGTNQLHGLMSEQFRTALMQQRKFWDQYKVNQAPPNWPSQPGLWVMNPDAMMSGPVYIPKIYDGRNKTFFLFAWAGLLEKQSKQATDTVPTAAELGGDFSFGGIGNPIYDPTTTVCTPAASCQGTFSGTSWTRQQFPNNIIPLNSFSKVAKTVLGMNPYRLPNVAGTMTSTGPSNNIMLGPMKVVVWDNYQIRLDHQFTPSLKAFGTYVYNSRHERQPPYTINNSFFDSTLNLNISPRQNTVSLGTTWVPSPTLVNDLRFSYYEYGNITQSIAYNQNYAKTLGITGVPATCMPQIWPGGFSESLNVGCPSRDIIGIFTLKDDVSKAWGKHSFKMGYELLRWRENQWDLQNPDGTYSYSSTSGLSSSGGTIANTGATLAQFMVGAMTGDSFTTRLDSNLPRLWQHSWYAQDDWKITSNLTLNLGLRYNIETPAHQKHGIISIWDMNAPDNTTYTNTAYACPAGGCMGAYVHPQGADPYPMKFDKLDPRFGLAWHVLPRIVIRGGASVSHQDWRTYNLNTTDMMTDGYSLSQISGEHRPTFMMDQGIPAFSYPAQRADGSVPYITTNFGSRGGWILENNLHTPYVLSYNVGFQTQLSKDYLLDMQWRGASQVDGTGSYDLNARPWGQIPSPTGVGYMDLTDPANAAYRLTWANGGQTQYYRPWINLGTISMNGNDYHLSHNEAMVRIEKRYSKGLNFQVWYTYAKTLDHGAGNEYLNWSLLKARTSPDQTHNLTGSMSYEVPVGKGRHFLNHGGLVDKVLGQWNFVWMYTIASGNMGGQGVSGQPTTYNYPGYMPTYGSVMLLQNPKLRSDWQDIGTDRWNQYDMNSMIGNCGPVVLAWGNACYVYIPSFSRGTNGNNLWNSQRTIAASASIAKDLYVWERLKLQLRLDSQNPFKWYNWGGPNSTINVQNLTNASTFGTPGISSDGGTTAYGGVPMWNMTVALRW
jgi:hypothetical protein